MSFTIFPTALGECAVAWNDVGLVGVWLPESTVEVLRRRVLRAHPESVESAPPEVTGGVVSRITRLLAGEDVDLGDVVLDESGLPDLQQRIYAAARALPRGVTRTYGEIARDVGAPGAAQVVGQAMGSNPWPIVVPCHRVVAAGGRNGGFSAPGGVDTKLRMLAIEGATLF